jgi:hypothetical protein
MRYSQEITLKLYYDPEEQDPPEDWTWHVLADCLLEDVEMIEAGPILVEEERV